MTQNLTAEISVPQGPQILVPMTRMPNVPALFAKLLTLSMVRPSQLSANTTLKNFCMVIRNHRIDIPLPVKETIGVPENIGRQYASVSGGYNPHHRYGWTARFIGFKQAIAHGMWSLARSCASLEKALGYPDTFELDGQFKRPIFLPSTITLGYASDDDGAEFELRDHGGTLPHLKGHVRI